MVVLSAAIVTTGKTLIARQFVEMTRLRIEGLLSAFQKLVDTGRDHTFIETETVRYVYQPIEAMQLVLVTNKSSNILEDIETLRLMAKVVQDCCQIQVNEELVLKNALDIVFAFDEVISFGHRESVTLSQIKTYTEMDSHEEKLHQMIEQSKINEAKEMAKKKQAELKAQKMQDAKDGKKPAMEGFGGGGPEDSAPSGAPKMGSMGGFGGGSSFQDSMSSGGPAQEFTPGNMNMGGMEDSDKNMFKPTSGPKKGMALGKKRPGDIFGGPALSPAEEVAAAEPEAAAAAAPVNPLLDPVKVEIEEKITADLSLEGGMEGEASCTGQFQVTVLDAAKADLVCFKLNPQDQAFKYKVHPNLNKASYSNNALEVRDNTKAFRANQPAPLLKWQMKSGDEEFLPVQISCWPSSTSDGTQIVVELELTDTSMVLEDVHIRFPAPQNSRPSVSSASPGEAGFDGGCVHWIIPQLDSSESSGTMEFSAAADQASLVPGEFVATRRDQTKCPMDIVECYHLERKDAISVHLEKSSMYQLKIGS
jgi:hypothetical protein